MIITNFNYADFVGEAINSVINQDYPTIEIIVVDDGSTDNSHEVISEFGKNIKFISKANGGVSSARNMGMNNARGDFFAFLDADDFWTKDKIRKQVEKILESNNHLVYCKMNSVDSNGNSELSSEKREGNFKEIFSSNPGKTPFPPSSVLITRHLALQTGFWNIELRNAAEDFDFFRRCSRFSNFSVVDENLLVHREHKNSLTAGPLGKYFRYNVLAMLLMYSDPEFKLNKVRERMYILKFYWSFVKAFVKSRKIGYAILVSTMTFMPKKLIWSLLTNKESLRHL